MKKKIIKSLKISSLLGFVGNNIKADYKLYLTFSTDFYGGFEVDLEGDNNIILNDPTKCTNGDFDDILKNQNKIQDSYHKIETKYLADIKKNFIPVYYKLKDKEDFILINDERNPDGNIDFKKPEDVEEVIYILNNTSTNKVTVYSGSQLRDIIKNKKFVLDENYIYRIILDKFNNFKDLNDVKKHIDINIKSDDAKTYDIEIIYNCIFKISDSVELKISEKDIKNNDFITPLNNLENLYINIDNVEKVFDKNLVIKKTAIIYTFDYKSKKYYIISDKKHKYPELLGFLKKKESLKDKDLIFDPNGEIKVEGETGFLVPGEYKIIDKEKPEEPETTLLKYKFTGDNTLSKHIGKDFVVEKKVKVQSLFDNQNTDKYIYVAIKEGTNERFINDQTIESGTYELKREEKTKEEKEKNNGQGENKEKGTNESKKLCGCY